MGAHPEETEVGRWQRARRSGVGRSWLRAILVVIVVPILLGLGVILIAGRGPALQVLHRLTVRKFPDVQWITPGELASWRADPSRPRLLVLDARTVQEYEVSHLQDAVRIEPARPSLRVLAGQAKDAPLVVYSSLGYRGARVAHWLAGQGYSNVRNLEGGIFQWVNQGQLVFRDSRPTAEVHPYDRRWGLLLESRYRAPVADVETPFAAP
jgi:rhodanese-related sulfurtransferase